MRYILAIFLSSIVITAISQDKKNILKKIRVTNSILNSYRKSERASVYELKLLNNKIDKQQSLINHIEQDISSLNEAITNLQDSLDTVQKRYNQVKDEYKKMIQFAYLNKDRYQPFLFVFSASSFNQAYKRFLYIQNYSARRKHYINLLEKTSKQIAEQQEVLKEKKQKKRKLRKQYNAQLKRIKNQYREKEKLLANLRKKEEEVRQDLRNQVKLAQELNKKISQSIINNLGPSNEDANISGSSAESTFREYKGKLPWPVEQGVIMNKFGKRKHPFLKNVTISNSGIDISTLANASVTAVYDGKVTKVEKIAGLNYSVLLKHGNYYTLYSNLKELKVSKGDFVLAGDILGKVDFNFQDENQYYIKFQVWHKSHKLNPVAWLKNK